MKYYTISVLLFLLIAVATTGCTVEDSTGSVVSEEVVFDDDLFTSDEENQTNNTADQPSDTGEDTDEPDGTIDTDDTDDGVDNEDTEDAEEDAADVTLEVTEGDLVELQPRADDPDGDTVMFSFSEPLNQNGKWQTNEGDAGKYLITITADDGTSTTTRDVLLIVNKANQAPTVECPERINVDEGETVTIECNIFDIDGPDSDISVELSGWMREPVYETTYEDAGEHTVLVTATDAFEKSSVAEIVVEVDNVNRAPVFLEEPDDITTMEGNLITLDYEVSDPDGDGLTVTFSDEFDSQGTWQTEIGDAGTYPAFVAVSDGEFITQEEFEVVVQLVNTAPVLKPIPDVAVQEGETVTLEVDATDREGDDLTVTYEGWMNAATKETTFEDARPLGCDEAGCTAEYEVLVTVSDGFLETTQTVGIFVEDVDRPPVFGGILG